MASASSAAIGNVSCSPRVSVGTCEPDSHIARCFQRGDIIRIDAEKGTLDVKLSDAELAERRKVWTPRQNNYQAGALWKYVQTVGPAHKGAVTHPGGQAETHTYADI